MEATKLGSNSKKLTLATLFGVMIFLSKVALPSPIDKAFIIFQATLLSLGHLILGMPGATYISLVGGLLTALVRAPLAFFTITFALLYGLMIDVTSSIFKVREGQENVRTGRVIIAVTVSTAVVGLIGYYTSVGLQLLPRNPVLEISILIAGVINGVAGGFLSVMIWRRIFKRSR